MPTAVFANEGSTTCIEFGLRHGGLQIKAAKLSKKTMLKSLKFCIQTVFPFENNRESKRETKIFYWLHVYVTPQDEIMNIKKEITVSGASPPAAKSK